MASQAVRRYHAQGACALAQAEHERVAKPAFAISEECMSGSTRWKRRPEGSTWGDFGPDDQLGRLNLLTAQKVKQGVAEVKEGLTFCLSLPLDYPGGNVLNP